MDWHTIQQSWFGGLGLPLALGLKVVLTLVGAIIPGLVLRSQTPILFSGL